MDLFQQWKEPELLELVIKLKLHFVLHVPNLSCNLLSISKLTLGKRIGNARECEGLYYFEKEAKLNKQAQTTSCKSFSRGHKIMLRHHRLGHPSFSYIRILFPSLFHNGDLFQCEIC